VAWRWAGIGSRLLAGHRCCWGRGNRVLSQCSEGKREGPGSWVIIVGLSRMVTWRRASGVAMGGHW